MDSTPSPPLAAVWWGRRDFAPLAQAQLDHREAMLAGRANEELWFVEHPTTITVGRRGDATDLRWSTEELARRGIAVVEAPRGGELTMHAPGQLVAYPLVHIGRKVREHVVRLAETAIEVFGELGVTGVQYNAEHPGVWRGDEKFASLGIHVSRGVAVHGIALNIAVDARLFDALVSCGLPQARMTSAADVGGTVLPLNEVAERFALAFSRRCARSIVWHEPTDG